MAEEVKRCKKCTDFIADLEERLNAWRAAGDFVESDIKTYARREYDRLVELGEIKEE